VPPSGPMDALSFRLGNRLLGNDESAAGLEFTAAGPTLMFNAPARVCLTGADFGAKLDGAPAPRHAPFGGRAGCGVRERGSRLHYLLALGTSLNVFRCMRPPL